MRIIRACLAALSLSSLAAFAQTNQPALAGQITSTAPASPNEEAARAICVKNRRIICGKVLEITKEGLIVDSGYSELTRPPFNKSWRVPGNVSLTPDAHAVEGNFPGAPCVGLVFLASFPKRPAIKLNDYVVLQAYPAGQYLYTPVPDIHKPIRKFAGSLAAAVALNLKAEEK